jgi:hypothetical protein
LTFKITGLTTHVGTSTQYGAADIDKYGQYFSGIDISATESPDINTVTKFRDSKLIVRDPANTRSVVFKGVNGMAADRTATLPALSANDTFVFQNQTQTLSGKTFTSPVINSPTITLLTSYTNAGGNTITVPGSATTLVGRDTVDTLTNKTISATGTGNILQAIVVSPEKKRMGYFQPGSSSGVPVGVLADHTKTGASSIATTFDTTEGVVTTFTTTATGGLNAGLVSPTTGVGVGRRLFAARMKTRSSIDSTTSARYYIGWTSATALPISDTPLATTDSGILVGWSSTDTNWTIYTNNGGGSAATKTNVTGPIAKNAVYHDIEISWAASGNVTVIFDGTSQTVSTALPATTTNLYYNHVAQTTTTTARSNNIKYVWYESDK